MKKVKASWAICSILMLGLGFAQAGEVWITGPSHRVLRKEKPKEQKHLYDGKKKITLYAAKNEFVAFQIVYGNGAKGVTAPEITLKGKGAELKADVFKEHYVPTPVVSQFSGKEKVPDAKWYDENVVKKTGSPREFPVHMVPPKAKKYGFPFTAEEGNNEVVWVEFFVPEDAAKGKYKGSFKTGGKSFSVELVVWDFALPSVSHFPYWAYGGPEQIAWGYNEHHTWLESNLESLRSYYKISHNHRLSMTEGLEKWMTMGGYGRAKESLATYTGDLFKNEKFAPGFGYEMFAVYPNQEFYDIFKDKKMLNRIFHYTYDEPSGDEYAKVNGIGKSTLSKYNGQFRTMVTEQYESALSDGITIFCSGQTPADKVNSLTKDHKSGGKTVFWTYNSGHAGSAWLDAPGQAIRTHSWSGYITGVRSWFFWDAVYIVDKQMKHKATWRGQLKKAKDAATIKRFVHDHWNDGLNFDEAAKPDKRQKSGFYPKAWALRLNGDGLLLYPGHEAGLKEALGCFRLKNIRRGAQDFEYLYLLEKMGQKDLAESTAKGLLGVLKSGAESSDGQAGGKIYHYEKDETKWDLARIELGKALDKIGDKKLREKISPYNQYPNPVGHPDYFNGDRF